VQRTSQESAIAFGVGRLNDLHPRAQCAHGRKFLDGKPSIAMPFNASTRAPGSQKHSDGVGGHFGHANIVALPRFNWQTQADSLTARRYGGTGLGLALSRKLAPA
jgi:hypothetical protein